MKLARPKILLLALSSVLLAGYITLFFKNRERISGWITGESPVLTLQRYPSPDGVYEARVYFKYDDPRVPQRFWTFVRLARVASPSEKNDRVFTLRGSTAIDVHWTSDRKLSITYAGTPDLDLGKPVSEFDGIVLSYSAVTWPNKASEPTAIIPPPAATIPAPLAHL